MEELHSQLNSNVDSGVDESEPQVDLELELSENGPTVIKLADKEEDTADTEHFKVIQESDKLEELEENLNNIIDDSLKEIKLNQKKKSKRSVPNDKPSNHEIGYVCESENDGNTYEVVANKNGVLRWKKKK